MHTQYGVRFLVVLSAVCLAGAPLLTQAAATYDTQTFLGKSDAGNAGPAVDAYVDEPKGLDVSLADVMYIADSTNNVIEKIDTSGVITRIAGSGEYGNLNGTSLGAQFAAPEDIAVYGNGEQIFIADTANNAIRKIEHGAVTTFLSGLSSPRGLALSGDTLFVSDTGHGRIIAINRNGGGTTEFASGLNQPTKLLYWSKARSIFFINSGEGEVSAVNVDTGTFSNPLIKDLEDIGGIYRDGRQLYVASSYSIGVFNEMWRVKLAAPDPSGVPVARSTTLLAEHRETEHLNFPSDIYVKEDTLQWEEYYNWDMSALYRSASADAQAVDDLQCVPIKKYGEGKWRKRWFMRIDKKQKWQSAQFVLKEKYQGDEPFFRVKMQYDNPDHSDATRAREREDNQSRWKKGRKITEVGLSAPAHLELLSHASRAAVVGWDAVDGAETYSVQLWRKATKKAAITGLTDVQHSFGKEYLRANTGYKFRVRTCVGGECSSFSDFKQFRTEPATPNRIEPIQPARGQNILALDNGNFLVTLRFKLRKKEEDLRAKVQLCTRDADHPKTITKDRIYVMYTGGSSVLVWRKKAARPQIVVGKHRFEDEYGAQADALVGRPKDIVFNANGSKMYIAENNKFAVYDFGTQQLTALAGDLMDSYREAQGPTARFSDPTSITLSPDDEWIYMVDRNNHRIRRLNTETGETEYVTGAGGTNFSFESSEGNGYAEGGPCEEEMNPEVAGCAYFNRPTGIAISPDGNTLYVAEGSNNRIRAVDVDTRVTSLVAGSGATGFSNGVGSAASFNGPYTVDVSSDGKTLYVADKYNHAIRAITLATRNVSTLVGTGAQAYRDGSFSSAALAIPEYVKEENGTVYWTEAGTQTVRAASLSSRQVTTVSGNTARGLVNGAGATAEWNNPKGFDFRAGKIYVADYTNDVIRTIQL